MACSAQWKLPVDDLARDDGAVLPQRRLGRLHADTLARLRAAQAERGLPSLDACSPSCSTSDGEARCRPLEELLGTLLYEGYALYPYTPGAAKNATPTPFGSSTAGLRGHGGQRA